MMSKLWSRFDHQTLKWHFISLEPRATSAGSSKRSLTLRVWLQENTAATTEKCKTD